MVRPPPIDAADAARTAAEIFIHGFPLALSEAVRRSHPLASRDVHLVTEGADALGAGLLEDDGCLILTSAWIDLAQDPVVLCLPHTRGRFIATTLIDTAGEPFASVGSRTGDDAGVDLALVGPNWRGELPSGLIAQRAPCNWIWALTRLYAFSDLDLADALQVARRQCLATASPDSMVAFSPPPSLQSPSASSVRQVAEMKPAVFFHRLPSLLEKAPRTFRRDVGPQIAALCDQLGGPPPAAEWTPEFERSLDAGFADALRQIRAQVNAADGASQLGWRLLPDGFEGGNLPPLERAARACASLGAPIHDDVLTFTCSADEAGRTLSGAERYCLHFPPNGMPPVRAFWRLSTRDDGGGRRKRSIGDRSDLELGPDGSLDIVIQRTPPSRGEFANWLPAPAGEFSLCIRLHWPTGAAMSGAWRMPPVTRLGSRAGRWSPDPRGLRPSLPRGPLNELSAPRLA